jgi:DNA-directed RNA polymerase specialized sigma24 family protein
MEGGLPLDSVLREYHKGNLNKKKLEGIIFEYILKNSTLFRLNHWPKDECIDFLCWFYPRISRAIDKYRKTGSSFDAYVAAMIRWASREYIRVEKNHRITEKTYWDACAREMTVREAEPAYGDSDNNAPFRPAGKPRQILLLLLKSYYFISEDFIDKAAPAIGMERERLKHLIERLRNMRVQRDESIKNIQDRIHTLHYRCIAFERRMNTSLEGSAGYEKLKSRLERTRRRLVNMRNRFKRMRAQPTNQQVAQVLGLPKGTIDSNLFTVRTKFECEIKGERFPAGNYFDEDSDDDSAGQIIVK